MNKIYIETYGCQMNEYDTEIVKSILKKKEYKFTDKPEDAEIIFLNTCSVRENAHQKVHQRINVLKQLRREKKDLLMGVLGCMAQNLRQELLEDKVGVDIIAGPDSYKKLPQIIANVRSTGEKEFELTLSEFETYSDVFPTHEGNVNTWIAVMRGCDNFCTFCVVPYTRGRERSRDPKNVVDEVKQLTYSGFKQVTLLGQNVNSYKFDKYDFTDLVERVCEVAGIDRVRFTSPHPKDFPPKLIDVVANNEKVCKHIHLPLQAGNDRILEMMNRTYTQKEFLELVDVMRDKIPKLVLTTDIIVGFPTESDDEYADTLKVIEQVEFDSAFMFKYSERKNTIAQRKFKDDVPEDVKTFRMVQLVDKQRTIGYKKNQKHLGETFPVLIEGNAKKPGQMMGRNDGNKIVVFPDNSKKIGEFVNVKINEVTPNTLIGCLVE
jgi:tRNA-2-methylthio-N6-dimethylallyladenosine synthase